MKYLIALLILGAAFTIEILTSCSHYCKPANIESGKSSQHHDTKKFRATYTRKGNFWIVTCKNMNEERKNIVTCKPPFKNGSWVNL